MDKAQECRVLTERRERMMEIEALNEELIWLGDYVIPTYERERAFKKKNYIWQTSSLGRIVPMESGNRDSADFNHVGTQLSF